jgi:2-keto-3-deoxy-6-phosphogluconate aldolase
VTDAEWFNPEVYDGSIYAQAWTEGQYATTVQNFMIRARSANVLTINTNLTATTLATNLTAGLRTLMSFQAYTSSNTMFQNAFAHIADNASTPTLGAAADSAKEYG